MSISLKISKDHLSPMKSNVEAIAQPERKWFFIFWLLVGLISISFSNYEHWIWEIKHILHKAQNEKAFSFERNAAFNVLIDDLLIVYNVVFLYVYNRCPPQTYCKNLIIDDLFYCSYFAFPR